MSSREREGLIARIRQIRRTTEPSPARARASEIQHEDDELQLLEDRLTHLERLVQGLQDSVHRESKRQAAQIAELEAQVQPAALGRALSEDARNRGL